MHLPFSSLPASLLMVITTHTHTHTHMYCIIYYSSTDGEDVGERGPGDGREAGQDELIELPSDDENETTPALTLDPTADHHSADRSLSASHGGWTEAGMLTGIS